MHRLPGGQVSAILDELGSHSSTAERRARQRILRFGESAIPELLDTLTHHQNAWAHAVAAATLAHVGGRARPALLRALRDPAMPVRLSALVALNRTWDRSVIPAVIRLLKDRSGGVRGNAAALLGRHRGREASKALVRLLEDPKWYVRQQAARALGQLGVRRVRGPLLRAMSDSSRAVRDATLEALKRLDGN